VVDHAFEGYVAPVRALACCRRGRPSLLHERQLLVDLVLLAALLSSACQWGAEPDPTLTLTWWITASEDDEAYAAFEAIAQAYAEQTEGVEVELVPVPWDGIAPRGIGLSQLDQAMESETGPDLWGPVPCKWTGSFVEKGQLAALDAAQLPAQIFYASVALQACTVDSKLYGLPVLMDSLALIYNRQLVPEPPASFAELVSLAKQLAGGESKKWVLALPLLSQYHIYPLLDGYGGYIFGQRDGAWDLRDIGLHSEGAVRGIRYLSNLYTREDLFPDALADRAVMYTQPIELFAAGQAATLIEGAWVLPQLEAGEIDYGVAPIPLLPGSEETPRSLTLVQAIYVNATSQHSQETLDLISYLAGEESTVSLQRALGTIPVRRDLLRAAALRSDSALRTWYELASAGVPLPNAPELDALWLPWGQALEVAIPGLTPADEALQAAVEQSGLAQPEEEAR
jgi:arabinogalactan oligomer/maltooligosaccharide transport system substrate-binding protein